MRRCRRRTFLLVLVVCGVSICLCFHSVSLLSREQGDSLPSRMFVQHRIEPREVVMNGQREILNVDHQPPVMVATVSSSGKARGHWHCEAVSVCHTVFISLVGYKKLFETCRQLVTVFSDLRSSIDP